MPTSIDTNLPAPAYTRTYLFPDGSLVTVPFAAGVTRTADGQVVNLNASRPNPNFGSIARTSSIGESWYRAMFLELRRRFAKNYQFGVSYTLVKAENTGGSANGSGTGPSRRSAARIRTTSSISKAAAAPRPPISATSS